MDERYQKFLTSKQEPLRLSIAIEGFLHGEPDTEDWTAYRDYLHRRLQPAAAALIEADNTAGLRCLAEQGWLGEKLTDELIRRGALRKPDSDRPLTDGVFYVEGKYIDP